MADYRQDSAYATTEMYSDYLDVMSHRNIPVHDDDTLFTITSTYQHRPDLQMIYITMQTYGGCFKFVTQIVLKIQYGISLMD
jgi:ABC-type uncharacterized transport system permease subunit